MWLDRYATYSGSDPRRAPAVLATIPYVEQTFGAWHLRGGLRRLGDALRARWRALGVVVLLTPPSRITGRLAAGCPGCGSPMGGACPPTWWSPTPTQLVYDRLLPRRRPGVRRAGWAGHRVAVRLRAAARRDGAHAGPDPQQRLVPPRVRRRVRRDLRPTPEPVDDPTIYVRSPTTRRCAPPTANRGSCWSTRPGTPRRAGSTGTPRAWPTPTPTGCWPGWPNAAPTSGPGALA